MKIIIAIVLFIIVIGIDACSDSRRIQKNLPIDHKRGNYLRMLGLIPVFLLFFFPLNHYTVSEIFAKVLIISWMMMSWWWEFFDGSLNLLRGKSWRYNGSDDEDDAFSDDLLQGIDPIHQAILKWSLIGVSTLLYIALF